ncbi:MAG: TonB family protein [Pseudomonadota bacterium]
MRVLLCVALSFLITFMGPNAQSETNNVAAVLKAQQAFTASETKATRRALLDALDAYDGETTVETVQAYLAVLVSDTGSGDYTKIRESGLATATHLEPVSDILPRQYVEAKYVAAAAYFNGRQHPNAMLEMAQVEGFSAQFLDATGEQPDWADKLRWQADAWGLAMRAYFQSAYKRHPSDADIDAILASYGVNTDAEAARLAPGDTTGLPHCPGRLIQRPRMRYPTGGVRRGLYGSVILRFAFGPEGGVVDPEILASVPEETFDERALSAVQKWRFKPDKASDVGSTCALERTNVVLPVVFLLN